MNDTPIRAAGLCGPRSGVAIARISALGYALAVAVVGAGCVAIAGCGSQGANAKSQAIAPIVEPAASAPVEAEPVAPEPVSPASEVPASEVPAAPVASVADAPLAAAPLADAPAEIAAEVAPATTEIAAAPVADSPVVAPTGEVPAPADDGPPRVSPATTRPKADRRPRRPGEAEKITFDDIIIGVQADVVFRPWMLTERVQELEGQRVSIPGFMYGGVEKQSKLKDFILLRNNQCKFGPGGQSDHLAKVILRDGRTTDFTAEPLNVEGTLRVAPFTGTDGNTWAIYELQDAVLK